MENYSWPSPYDDLEMPRELAHVVGCIILAWNWCESCMNGVIKKCLAVDYRVASRIVEPLGNTQRTNLLRGLCDEKNFGSVQKDHIRHAIKMYEICQENRNLVAHSILTPDPEYLYFSASKAHPNIQERVIDPDLSLLTGVLQEIQILSEYLSDMEDRPFWHGRPTSLEKPPLPNKLSLLYPPQIIEKFQR